jgi:hypothetical protein
MLISSRLSTLSLIASLLLSSAALAQETALPKNQSIISGQIDNNFPDNTAGKITPATLRSVLHTMNASYFNSLTTPFGSGVSSALANPVNASGGVVTYSGALGTPASGNLGNTTGFPLGSLSGAGSGFLTGAANPVNMNNGFPLLSGSLTNGHALIWNGGVQDAGFVPAQPSSCSSSQWFYGLATSGVLSCAQPQFSDLANTTTQLFGTANTWTEQQAFNDFIVYSTDTGSPYRGQISTYKTSWSPPAGAWNEWFKLQIAAVKVIGGTLAQRQAAEQHGISIQMTADPANGMAGSHAVPFVSGATIPAGLPDGTGTPSTNYQEISAFSGNTSVLSNGDYSEGIASYARDNDGTNFAQAKISTFFASMNKGTASNTYPYYGFQAYSNGTQQTTYAPNAAFRVDGGWQYNIDLRGNANPGAVDVALYNGHTIAHDATNTYINSGTSNTFNSNGFTTKNVTANGSVTASNGYTYQNTNMSGATPISCTQGSAIGWNQSNGTGENNLVDCYGGAAGGFWFQKWNGSAITTYGKINGSGMQITPVAIASLVTCGATNIGAIAIVNNGTAYGTGTYGSAVSATGAVTRKVICTNTAGATTYAWAYN